MADAYTATIYASAALAAAAINGTAADKLVTVVSYFEAGAQRFLVVAKT